MTVHNTTVSSESESQSHSTGFFDWLSATLRRLFAGASANTLTNNSIESAERSASSNRDEIIAPGGFVIRRNPVSVNGAGININSFDELVPDVRQGLNLLPPLPTVVTELLKEIQSSSSTALSVANIVTSDPSLAAALLRAVNSSSCGMSQKVTSVPQAVSLLGFGAVRSLVVRLGLDGMLKARSPEAAIIVENLWTHSLAVSYIAAALASHNPEVDRGFLTTLGLLHDIGRLATCSQDPDPVASLKAVASAKGETRLEREEAVFGGDHAVIGAMLGNRWKLPADLIMAIRWHHFPAKAFEPTDPPALRKAVYLLHLADQLAKLCFAYADDVEIDLPEDGAMGLNGPLQQLLDDKVRAAATQAILFADENSQRPITVVRPFLKLNREEAVVELCQRLELTPGVASRITTGDAGAKLFGQTERAFNFDPARPAASPVDCVSSACFSAPATAEGAQWLAKSLPAQWHIAGISSKFAGIGRTVLRALLPNLIAGGQSIDIAWNWAGSSLQLAVRSHAMAFAHRLPPTADARRVLEAELANVLNLGWFNIESSEDGAILFLQSR